ncbi:MAG: hypothetical protein HYX79_09310 [Chloroflexi bacterium]|nr:hypothetical protein [Chloroflexota bacterium]
MVAQLKGRLYKDLIKFTPSRIALLIAPVLALLSITFGNISESFQEIVSSNQTIQKIQEVTKMPGWFVFWVLLPLAVAVFAYLWVKAGKEDNSEQLLADMNKTLKAIARKLGVTDDDYTERSTKPKS